MKTIKAKRNQTVYDIAIEQYGNCDAVSEIIMNNPGLRNDTDALDALEIDSPPSLVFFPDIAVEPNLTLVVDPESSLRKNSVIKQLETEITTFDLKDDGTEDQ